MKSIGGTNTGKDAVDNSHMVQECLKEENEVGIDIRKQLEEEPKKLK